jgi:hypothetical protein
LRKSLEVNPIDAAVEDVEDELLAAEVAEDTVMTKLSSSRIARRNAF